MVLLSPQVKELVTPCIRQGVCDKRRKPLIYLCILTPDWSHCPDAIHWSDKRGYIQSLLDKLRIVGEVRQSAPLIPSKPSYLLVP